MNTMQKRLLILALCLTPVLANAELAAVTGTDGAPLVYDSLNNVTWTANANLFASQYNADTVSTIIADAAGLRSLKGYTLTSADFTSSGAMTWYGAVAWVNYLNRTHYGGASHWALPTTINSAENSGYPDGIGADPASSTSQLATLFYLELGQVAGVPITTTNNGAAGFDLFSNVQAAGYAFLWGITQDTFTAPGYAWSFDPDGGNQFGVAETLQFFAMPMTPGQVDSAPSVSPAVTSTLGTNGWYVGHPTTLSWTVTGRPVPTKSGCAKVNVPDTTGKSYTCSATNEMGTASNSVTIKKDTVSPTVALIRPTNGATYTLNQSVRAAYSCADSTSGVASCVGTAANGARITTSSAGTHAFSVTATDNAGNTITKPITYAVTAP